MKIDDLYGLYVKCFPDYLCSKDTFEAFLNPQQAVIFTEYDNDRLIAYTIVWGNSISLLCVDPEYQNKGIGTRLLHEAESHIKKIVLQRFFLAEALIIFFKEYQNRM